MALFTKKNLENLYSWTTVGNDDPKVSGPIDATFLSRKEGYEVLYFINKFMQNHNLKNVSTGQKIEGLIKKAPSAYHSQKKVYDWIVENWNN